MNPYLTKRADRLSSWRRPVMIALLLLAALIVKTMIDFIVQGDWETALAGLVMLALCLWPAIRWGRGWLYIRRAVALTGAFQQAEENALTQIECPRCGAMNQALRGSVSRCA